MVSAQPVYAAALGQPLIHAGKVRELYALPDRADALLMATASGTSVLSTWLGTTSASWSNHHRAIWLRMTRGDVRSCIERLADALGAGTLTEFPVAYERILPADC